MVDDTEGRFRDLDEAADASGRPVFVLRVRAEPGVDPIRAIRWMLKSMKRGYGLRCLSVTREPEK